MSTLKFVFILILHRHRLTTHGPAVFHTNKTDATYFYLNISNIRRAAGRVCLDLGKDVYLLDGVSLNNHPEGHWMCWNVLKKTTEMDSVLIKFSNEEDAEKISRALLVSLEDRIKKQEFATF